MKKQVLLMPIAVALCVLATTLSAQAGTVTFDFGSLGGGVDSRGIQTYLQGLVSGRATVSVAAASTPARPGTDAFLRSTSGIAGWLFTFGVGYIDSVEFDYEMFPDVTCTQLSPPACGGSAVGGIYPSQADLAFSTNLGQIFEHYALKPGSGASGPAGSARAPTDTHLLISGSTTTEKAPSLIGNSGLLNGGAANALAFMDWPAVIGIDHLVIDDRNPPDVHAVPGLGTMLLVGSGVTVGSGLAIGLYMRGKARKA